jgi:hypothetical protein
MADPLKERISLLQMGEAQGKLRPEHQKELDAYRARGLIKGQSAPPVIGADGQSSSGGGALETAKARDTARAGMTTIERLVPALARVRKLQGKTLGASGLQALGEFNPFDDDNQQYDAAVSTLTALARPATRTPGEGSMSDFESKMAKAILPDRWKRDKYNNEALDGLDNIVSTSRRSFAEQLGLPQPPPTKKGRPDASALRAKYGLK